MGSVLSAAWASWFAPGKEQKRIALVGLDAAGKTTLMYALKSGEAPQVTVPTIGFNLETIETEAVSFTAIDLGGQDRIRRLWRHYMRNLDGLIFVVDSAHHERLSPASEKQQGATADPDPTAERETTAEQELSLLLQEPCLDGLPILVYANKQDLPGALSSSGVAARLGLHRIRNRRWKVKECAAVTGTGVREGLQWLAATLSAAAPTLR